MKYNLLVLFCFLPLFLFSQNPPTDTIFQHWHQHHRQKPTETEVLLKIEVFDFSRQRIPDLPVCAVQLESGKVWQGRTGAGGEVYFLVPKGKGYRLDAGREQGLKTVRLPNASHLRSSYGITYVADQFSEKAVDDTIVQEVAAAQAPTRTRVLVHLKVLNFEEKALEGEAIYFAARKSGKVYLAETNPLGLATLMLPKGDTFYISTRFIADVDHVGLPQNEFAETLHLTYHTLGSKAILARRAERARQAAVRDSLLRLARVRDSLRVVGDSLRGRFAEKDFLYQLKFSGDPAEVQQLIEQRAAKERELIKADEKYFERSGEEIKAVLYRLRTAWAKKVIVTDITGSMYPYLDQLLLWHALQLTQGEDNRYLFFNDGDQQAEVEKAIGSTGGIYHTDAKSMDELLQTMVTSMRAGYGADAPENDLEATLAGVQKLRGYDELILIADNYSDVRDIELLTELKVPVHIVLAGADYGVNEDYLEIAYKTKGSIHTLQQDINNLAKLADGQTIAIGGYQYRVSKGKFLRISGL